MLDSLCDPELCPWRRIPGMSGPIDIERKGCESIGSRVHFVTLNFDIIHDLDLELSRSNFKKLHLTNNKVNWHGTKEMGVDKMLNPRCDIELWSWPWTFKVKLWNRRMPRMVGPIDMERKGCESMCCGRTIWPWSLLYPWPWTLIFKDKFSNSHISGMKREGCESDTMLDPQCSPGLARELQHIPNTVHWPRNVLMQHR